MKTSDAFNGSPARAGASLGRQLYAGFPTIEAHPVVRKEPTKAERLAKFLIEHPARALAHPRDHARMQRGLARLAREKDLQAMQMNKLAMHRAKRVFAYRARLEGIFEALKAGKTYAEIGESMHITKQRVGQLVKLMPKVLKKTRYGTPVVGKHDIEKMAGSFLYSGRTRRNRIQLDAATENKA